MTLELDRPKIVFFVWVIVRRESIVSANLMHQVFWRRTCLLQKVNKPAGDNDLTRHCRVALAKAIIQCTDGVCI